MESYFSSLKTERTDTYRTGNEARTDAYHYIERFYIAIHSTIRHLSPVEFYMRLVRLTTRPSNRQQLKRFCGKSAGTARLCKSLRLRLRPSRIIGS
jgi:hypothetical protein